jgi:protein-S-isoprenylcysteine O-methyltransferase Ste14
MMQLFVYLISAFLLVVAAFVIFRIFVRRDYQQKGRLTWFSSFLELLIWGLYMSFPYIYNPPVWVRFWSDHVPVSTLLRMMGVVCIISGLVLAFITMFWFGLRRAFGLEVNELIQAGPYRVTRNPQIVGGFLLVVGSAVLWPSWYAIGWVILYLAISHLMITTEEEHLHQVYGEAYRQFCQQTPRYLGFPRRRSEE